MSKLELIREADNNVVLRAGYMALRFFWRSGGTPREWWHDGFNLLTNPFPGSAAGINWEEGQDPTEMSANGMTDNPISVLSNSSTWDNAYYGLEDVFDTSGLVYAVRGFAPDFWLSAEAADDYVVAGDWQYIAPTTIVFKGSKRAPVGLIYPGNEMEPGKPREYQGGNCAMKALVSFAAAPSGAMASIVFRRETIVGNGYALELSKEGSLTLRDEKTGKKLAVSLLSKAERKLPVLLEVRTSTNTNWIGCYVNGRIRASITDSNHRGPFMGLLASAKTGYIAFDERQPFDTNMAYRSEYRVVGEGKMESSLSLSLSPSCSPVTLYRTNLPGIFLNQQTFPLGSRYTAVRRANQLTEFEGVVSLSPGVGLWAGARDGSHGIYGTIKTVEVDGKPAAGAHALLSRRAHNDEFVMMLNALPINFKGKVSSAKIVTEWKVEL